jgi:trans-aconitate methyltransferase
MSDTANKSWNPALYDAKMAFVSQLGSPLLGLLAPQPGERILDLGCGTGDLTAELARLGVETTGIDFSASMIEQARAKHPGLEFTVADATAYRSPRRFDGVFSNAALHWIKPAEAAIESVRLALRPGGRFAAEFGGKGNIGTIAGAIVDALTSLGIDAQARNPWYYPSIGEYTTLLEQRGFRVRSAELFPRPVVLADGEQGMKHWLDTFADVFFQGLAPEAKDEMYSLIEHQLRPKLFHQGAWQADYVRIRILAELHE